MEDAARAALWVGKLLVWIRGRSEGDAMLGHTEESPQKQDLQNAQYDTAQHCW